MCHLQFWKIDGFFIEHDKVTQMLIRLHGMSICKKLDSNIPRSSLSFYVYVL